MLLILEPTTTAGAGMTRPRLCRLSDENFYYVKGRTLTPKGLVSEYICAQLGREFGLPIPDFELKTLPAVPPISGLIELSDELGFGELFASKRVSNLMEIDLARAVKLPLELRLDVVAFDYWVGNLDRTLTEHGGNPNLFWDVQEQQLVVLDHNLDFDAEFELSDLKEVHVFREEIVAILSDIELKEHYVARFKALLLQWENIVETIPEAWLYSDLQMTSDAGINFEEMKIWLERLCHVDGWGL